MVRRGAQALSVTHDAGDSWHRRDTGFPERVWFTVKRQVMCADGGDPLGLYLGTTRVGLTRGEGPYPHPVALVHRAVTLMQARSGD